MLAWCDKAGFGEKAKTVLPSLYSPKCCGAGPSLLSAPAVLYSVGQTPAAVESSVCYRTKSLVQNNYVSKRIMIDPRSSTVLVWDVLTAVLFSWRRFSTSLSSCCLALTKSSCTCFVLDSILIVSAFCSRDRRTLCENQTTNKRSRSKNWKAPLIDLLH